MRQFIDFNKRLSSNLHEILDTWIPRSRGQEQFQDQTTPSLLRPGIKVMDVGGGKHPQISVETKKQLNLYIAGADIDEQELRRAPKGSYDELIIGDIATTPLKGDYDLIFSAAVMEHLQDPKSAVFNLAGALAPNGIMSHFIPARWALFAVVNRMLGPSLSRKILFGLHPEKTWGQGFPAYYRDCVPSRFRSFFMQAGLTDIQTEIQYASDYATFFAPLYLTEALRQIAVQKMQLEDLAETFIITGRRA